MSLVLAQLFPFISWNCAEDHCCKGQMQLLLTGTFNLKSQREREGGKTPSSTCNVKQKNQRRGWLVLLTKLSEISVSKPVFLNQKVLQEAGDEAGRDEAEACGWLVKDTAPAGDAAPSPGRWLQVHRVWDTFLCCLRDW